MVFIVSALKRGAASKDENNDPCNGIAVPISGISTIYRSRVQKTAHAESTIYPMYAAHEPSPQDDPCISGASKIG